MSHEFEALQARIRRRALAQDEAAGGELIGDYGATNPAEFFAVVPEVFFEQAGPLSVRHPGLFEVMRDFYALDPRDWA